MDAVALLGNLFESESDWVGKLKQSVQVGEILIKMQRFYWIIMVH
jgi:hypothetical protein